MKYVEPPVMFVRSGLAYYWGQRGNISIDTRIYYPDEDIHIRIGERWQAYSIEEYERIKAFLEAL